MKEIWKEVPFDARYKVSNKGNIKSPTIKENYNYKTNNMLKTITEKRKQQVKSILDVCTHVEVLDNGVHATGYITYEQMKQVVEYLETKIRQGFWYRCIKDVMDNTGEVCIFKAGNYYLCPKDGVLVTEDNRIMQWQAWHHPENCFVEDYYVRK